MKTLFTLMFSAFSLISTAHAAPVTFDCQLTLDEEVPVLRATMKSMSRDYDYRKGYPAKCDDTHSSLCTVLTEDMNTDLIPKNPAGQLDYSKLAVNVSTGTNDDHDHLTMALYKTSMQSTLDFTMDLGCLETNPQECTIFFKAGGERSETLAVSAPTYDRSLRARSNLNFSLQAYVAAGSGKQALGSMSFSRSIYAGPTPLSDDRTVGFEVGDESLKFSMVLTDVINPLETLIDSAKVSCRKHH